MTDSESVEESRACVCAAVDENENRRRAIGALLFGWCEYTKDTGRQRERERG